MFSDERGQGARGVFFGYTREIWRPTSKLDERKLLDVVCEEATRSGLYVHCNSVVLILYF